MKNRNKKVQSTQFMEQAIEKASNLIELLTNENEQLKFQNVKMSQTIDILSKNNSQAIQQNMLLKQQNYKIIKQNKEICQKNCQIKDYIKSIESSLEEKTKKNKQLHQKISEHHNKNQQLTKRVEKQNRKNLSLSNENEYLMKILDKQQTKENNIQNECKNHEIKIKNEMILIERTKQAFSRRCQEFKIENQKLKQIVLVLEEKNNEMLSNMTLVDEKLSKYNEIERQLKKTSDALSYLIESTLKVKPQQKLYSKIDQIKSYMCYRLQHMQNLMKPLMQLMKKVSPLSLNYENNLDVQTISTLANRLSTYLNQLLK